MAKVGATGGHQARSGTLIGEHGLRGRYMPVPVLYSGDTVNESSKALASFYLGAEGKADSRGVDQR